MVIAVKTEVTVSVQKLHMSLVKVAYKGGHHLVVGGRLVAESRDGVVIPHHDLPEYTPAMFPVDFQKWGDGLERDVSVFERRVYRVGDEPSVVMKRVGDVRACTLLFGHHRDPAAVIGWLKEQRKNGHS